MKHKEKRDLFRSGKSDEPLEDREGKKKTSNIKKGKETDNSKDKKNNAK